MADALEPEGFPDLFVYAVRDALHAEMRDDPDFPADGAILIRPVRPQDPSRSISVVEGDATPKVYEIGGRPDPSILTWTVAVQVFVKHSDETEGRNIRKRLLSRARKALFLPTTVSSIMTLNDGIERVSKFNMQRIDFASAEARDANKQFFLLGQIELTFDTELL